MGAFEAVAALIHRAGFNVVVVVVYRPWSCALILGLYISDLLKRLSTFSAPLIVIVGDFNIGLHVDDETDVHARMTDLSSCLSLIYSSTLLAPPTFKATHSIYWSHTWRSDYRLTSCRPAVVVRHFICRRRLRSRATVCNNDQLPQLARSRRRRLCGRLSERWIICGANHRRSVRNRQLQHDTRFVVR